MSTKKQTKDKQYIIFDPQEAQVVGNSTFDKVSLKEFLETDLHNFIDSDYWGDLEIFEINKTNMKIINSAYLSEE